MGKIKRIFKNFLIDEKGQMGEPIRLVIAVVVGVGVLAIMMKLLAIVGIIGAKYLVVTVSGSGIVDNNKFFKVNYALKNVKVKVRDQDTGRAIQGALVEIKGCGVNDAGITNAEDGIAYFSGSDQRFNAQHQKYAEVTITVKSDGYLRKDMTFLCK
ncbi:MAG: hypothetical protein V3T58_03100 [Candidatus Hydrothermarchaeales archaeon]